MFREFNGLRKPFVVPFADIITDCSLRERGISFRRMNRRVTEKILNCHQRDACLQHMSCGRVSHGMRRIGFLPKQHRMLCFSQVDILFEKLGDAGGLHMLIGLTGKNMALKLSGDSTPCDVCLQFALMR